MSIVNVLIIAALFGYSGWMIVRHVRKSKEGKCAACESKTKSGSCCSPSSNQK